MNNPLNFVDPLGMDPQDPKKPDDSNVPFDPKDRVVINVGADKDTGKPLNTGEVLKKVAGIALTDQSDLTRSNPDQPNSMQASGAEDTSAPGWSRLSWNFFTGAGTRSREEFGSNTSMTRGMRTSPDVDAARQAFLKCDNPAVCTRYPSGLRAYGPTAVRYGWSGKDGPFRSAWDRSMPRQFVGSFYITIVEYPGNTARFTLENTTGVNSGSYHLLPDAPWKSGPLSSTNQTYFWWEKVPK
jgi:hypothetical protein